MKRILYLVAVAGLALAMPAPASADAAQEANKKLVVEFYDKAINQKDFEAASRYFGNRYVQHNPNAPTASRASRPSSVSCARSSPRPGARSSACGPKATT